MSILKLSEKYSAKALEAACRKVLAYTSHPSYKSIKTIIDSGSAKAETDDEEAEIKPHGITRGADYYRR